MKKNELIIDEDFQAWEVYKHIPEHRWLFNKLEVALRQGLNAGPAATAPHRAGTYLHRPIYNLYGMGIGATKFEYNESMYDLMINNGVVPPGHFWCEWISGQNLSIDYERKDNGGFQVRSVWKGTHISDDNLVKFQSWERLEEPEGFDLLRFVGEYRDFVFIYHESIKKINIEVRGNRIIEFHFRWGNDPFDEYPVGTVIKPVWNDEESPGGEWKGNLHEDMSLYGASGFLSDVRRGYAVFRPE